MLHPLIDCMWDYKSFLMITSTIGCATIRFRYESLCLYRNGLSNNISLLIREIHHSQSKRKERSQSSKQWLDRQQKDPYVQKALELGLPSRAYFKLQEINEVIFPNLILKNKKKKRGSRVSNYSRRKRLIGPYVSSWSWCSAWWMVFMHPNSYLI